tara:strand:+ start:659 stop:1324 length:666 start_codon:yes stop_codon:yes gene_type:complete
MNRSKSSPSLPTIIEDSEFNIKKSMSQPELTSKKHIFTLKGNHLGLSFKNINGYAVLNNIHIDSSAYNKISIDYLNRYHVDRVNDFNFTTFNSIIKFINFIWSRDNEITLEFKELDGYEETELDVFYRENDLYKYKIKLYELGVTTIEDINYLEYHDLKIINMSDDIIKKICLLLNIEMNSNIYIKNDISIHEKQKLIDNFKKNKIDGVIFIELSDGWISI